MHMWERAGRGRQNVSVDSVPYVGATARLLFCRIAGFAGSAKGVDNGEDRKKTTGLSRKWCRPLTASDWNLRRQRIPIRCTSTRMASVSCVCEPPNTSNDLSSPKTFFHAQPAQLRTMTQSVRRSTGQALNQAHLNRWNMTSRRCCKNLWETNPLTVSGRSTTNCTEH